MSTLQPTRGTTATMAIIWGGWRQVDNPPPVAAFAGVSTQVVTRIDQAAGQEYQ